MNLKKNKIKGVTLIELMIVVAIISIFAVAALPKFANLINRAKESSVKANLSAIRSAIRIYYVSTEGQEPTTLYPGITGKFIKELPEGRIPLHTVTPNSWATNVSTLIGDSVDNNPEEGWIYDPANIHVFVNSTSEDTSGKQVNTW